MIRRVDHIGIAVRALEERMPFWAGALGLAVSGIETVETEGVKVAFLPVGDARLELLEATRPDSPIAKFLDKRGEGIHHLTLEVDSIDAILGELAQRGVELLDRDARPGAGGRRVAFLHPRAAGGVLVELVEAPALHARAPRLEPGAAVVAYLREPSEKLWGMLRSLDAAGIVIEGMDLSSFEGWVAQIERGEEHPVGPSTLFLPMARVEKILLDRASGAAPSLVETFERRTGRSLGAVLGT